MNNRTQNNLDRIRTPNRRRAGWAAIPGVGLAIALVLEGSRQPVCAAGALRVGAAQVKINPPPGSPLAGYYHPRAADGVLDDLHSKALVLDDGATKVALVVLDLISTTRPLVEKAREEIEKIAGVKAARVMISATHAHTGPLLSGRGSRDEALVAASDAAAGYSEQLPKLIAESVRLAEVALTDATLSVAVGECEDLS